jgi:hypothetical protein
MLATPDLTRTPKLVVVIILCSRDTIRVRYSSMRHLHTPSHRQRIAALDADCDRVQESVHDVLRRRDRRVFALLKRQEEELNLLTVISWIH